MNKNKQQKQMQEKTWEDVSAEQSLDSKGSSAGFCFEPEKNIILAPTDPALWPTFREQLADWRTDARQRLSYDDSYYRMSEFAWTASNFACAFVMMCDEIFFDPTTGDYTLTEFLDHGQREFGGYDSIVLWHAYPRLGVDQRNQCDFYRDMPGGLAGIRRLVEVAHQRDVRVFVNFNPWDRGTRRESTPDKIEMMKNLSLPWAHTYYSAKDIAALAEIVRVIEADGIFLDTMPCASPGLRKTLDDTRGGISFEGEMPLDLEYISDHHCSWAQCGVIDGEVPGVLRNRWFERRHMMHLVARKKADHTEELHTAWMNGCGIMVWENVFGAWAGWNARDRSILRAMLPIQRRFVALFAGEGWTPLVPTEQKDVYASLWQAEGLRLWTIVNRTDKIVDGELLRVAPVAGERCFDLVAGREVPGAKGPEPASFKGTIGPRGIGCFLAADPSKLGADFATYLERLVANHGRASSDTGLPTTTTRLVVPTPNPPTARVPEGMVELPAAALHLTIKIRTRECGFYEGSYVKDKKIYLDIKNDPKKNFYAFGTVAFQRSVAFSRFAMDEFPVTNAQFAEFLAATGFRPEQAENFLKHWVDGKPPLDEERHPVVYVDLDDARAYAEWAGKRLPTEEEWQYAAQGTDGRIWPWGEEMKDGCCNVGVTRGTTPVDAFLAGRSPCGCLDLCGNVWQWTESERSDGHTRFVMIRGGSWFEASGPWYEGIESGWYVSGGPRPVNDSTKFLLMWPGLDRCATIGFRCAVDMESE